MIGHSCGSPRMTHPGQGSGAASIRYHNLQKKCLLARISCRSSLYKYYRLTSQRTRSPALQTLVIVAHHDGEVVAYAALPRACPNPTFSSAPTAVFSILDPISGSISKWAACVRLLLARRLIRPVRSRHRCDPVSHIPLLQARH